MKLYEKLRHIDPRYLFILFFGGILYDTFFMDTYFKNVFQLWAAFLGFLGTDIIFNYLRHKKFIFPKSGFVSSLGTFALLHSPVVWPFFIAGALGAFSKHFYRIGGRHIFNPVTFAFVITRFFLKDHVDSGAATWSGQFEVIPYIMVAGILLVIVAKRWIISITFLGLNYIGHLYLHPWIPSLQVNPVFLPSFFLFLFFMISDPKTTPSKKEHQLLFGASLAALTIIMKSYEILSSQVLSLFIMNILYAIYIYHKNKPTASRINNTIQMGH